MKIIMRFINILSWSYMIYFGLVVGFEVYYPTPISIEKKLTDKSEYKEFCLVGVGGEDGKFTIHSNGSERIIDCNNL